jgi:ribosomal protein S18 acetylase RimI-like enzyme
MEPCDIIERLPTPGEYNGLRSQVGWSVYAEDVIAKALPNTLYCICALCDGKLAGMARVIGDGGMVYYIQDVIVVPECQRRGIGTQMMDKVMAYIRAHASQNTIVGLMSAKGKEAFYEKYGFMARPTEHFGAGMTIFWKVQ